MFSKEQKQKIAEEFEKLILSFNHPEMPKTFPVFKLRIEGKESWSWAEIDPNWRFSAAKPPQVNPWNENVANQMKEKTNERT